MTRRDDPLVPVADWELARHGKSKQPTRLVRRLRHLQYVLLVRRGDRRLGRLIRRVTARDRHEAARWAARSDAPSLVQFHSRDVLPSDETDPHDVFPPVETDPTD